MLLKQNTKMNKVIKIDFLKAKKPQNIEQFGYWLAGLIDADGYISKEGYISVMFHERDLGVAYYIKKIVGYGSIDKNKNSRSYRYRCCARDKVKQIGNIIKDKLRSPTRIKQFNERLVPKIHSQPTKPDISSLRNNHWLAGFIQGDGSFQIKINNRGTSKEQVMVVIQISQKKEQILEQIKKAFGGYIYYYKPQDYFFYSSSSIPNAIKFVDYLDHYQVIGSSFKIYQLWRQACLYKQKKFYFQYNLELDQLNITDLKTLISKLKMN